MTSKSANHKMRGGKGISLVEIIVALAVGLVLLASLYSLFAMQGRSLKIQEQVAELHQNTRAGIDMMAREIRMAGYNPSGSGSKGMITVGSGGITFSYYDDDGLKTVTYDHALSLGKPSLRRKVNAGTPQPVVENIESLLLDYDAGSGVVTITLTGRTERPDPNYTHPVHGDGYRRYTLKTTVVCRNLKP